MTGGSGFDVADDTVELERDEGDHGSALIVPAASTGGSVKETGVPAACA